MALDYRVTEETPERLVFKRRGFKIAAIIIFFFGGVALLAGIALFASSSGKADIHRFLIVGIGLLVVSIAYLINHSSKGQPKYFIFDHKNGILRVATHKQGGEFAELPYQQIMNFAVRRKISNTNSGSGNGNHRAAIHYIVYFVKKDGSIWELASYNRQSKAERVREQLIAQVDLSTPTKNLTTPRLPERVQLLNSGGAVSFQWRNPLSADFLGLIGLCFGLGFLVRGLDDIDAHRGVFWGVTVVASLLCLGVLFHIYNTLNVTHRVSVTDSKLERVENEAVKQTLPISEIASISFNFSTDRMGGDEVAVYNQKQHDFFVRKAQTGELEWSDISELFSSMKDKVIIRMNGLSVIEKMRVEHMLERVIFEKGGKEVL